MRADIINILYMLVVCVLVMLGGRLMNKRIGRYIRMGLAVLVIGEIGRAHV